MLQIRKFHNNLVEHNNWIMHDKQEEGLERHWASRDTAFKENIPICGLSDSRSEIQHLEELKEAGLVGQGIWGQCCHRSLP